MLLENAAGSPLRSNHQLHRAQRFGVLTRTSLLPAAALILLLSGAAAADTSSASAGAAAAAPAFSAVRIQETAQADTLPAPYRSVLEKYRSDLTKPEDEFEDGDYGYSCSIHELRNYILRDNSRTLGYFLKDLDDDGQPELLLGVNPGSGVFGRATEIIGIYTIVSGQAKRLRCGWSRSCYALTTERTLAYFGSSGAGNNVALQYVIKNHELHIKDGVRMTDSTPHGKACYRLTRDDIDAQPSEKDAVSDEEFSRYVDSLEKKARHLKLTPWQP